MPKKKPVKKPNRTNKKWDVQELERQAILFLLENQDAGFKEFCKKVKINEIYFYKICSVEKIYKEIEKIKSKRTQEVLEQVKKEYAKENRKEGSLISKLPGIAEGILGELMNDLKTHRDNLFYRSKAELFGKMNDTMKTIIELKEKGLMPGEVVLSEEKKEAKQRRDSRLDELIGYKKEKNDTDNKNIIDNGNTETPAN